MKKITLAFVVLLNICSGQILPPNFLGQLHANIGQLTHNIQNNVMKLQQNLQTQLQQVNEDVAKKTEDLRSGMNYGSILTTGNKGNTFDLIRSDLDENGYQVTRQERIIGDILYHVQKKYDPESESVRMSGFSLDLKDPDAKPVPIRF